MATPTADDLLRDAARVWLEEHGDPFPDGDYSTVGNPFIHEAERAFFAAWDQDGELPL